MTSGQLSVVRLLEDEVSALAAAFSAVEPWARYGMSQSSVAAYLASGEPGAPRYALRRDGTLLGALGIKANWLRGPYIQFLGILPEHQHQGAGAAALLWVEEEARRIEAGNVWVCASDFNKRALAFYERHGFARVAAIDGLIADGNAEILLRKRVRRP